MRGAPRPAPLGWHLQIWTDAAMLTALHDYLAELPVPLVIDHLGLAAPFDAIDDAGALARLRRWTGSEPVLEQVLVRNPAQLYGY